MGWIGCSETAPTIFIFSIILGNKYLSYVKFIAFQTLTLFGYILSVLASVKNIVYGVIHICNNGKIFLLQRFYGDSFVFKFTSFFSLKGKTFQTAFWRNLHSSSRYMCALAKVPEEIYSIIAKVKTAKKLPLSYPPAIFYIWQEQRYNL